MSHGSRIGFMVFGLGRAGVIHSTNLIRNPQATLKWIVDIDEDKAKKFVTENFMDTQVIAPSDMDKALLDPTVQAAVVATPTEMHEDIVMRCLRAGKAVFCEKPIAPTLQAIGKKLSRPLNRMLINNIGYFKFTCSEIFPGLFNYDNFCVF